MPANQQKSGQVKTRHMKRLDLPSVLEIEKMSFFNPWEEIDFTACFKEKTCVGLVAECNGKIAGFIIFESKITKLNIIKIAVHPEYRLRRIGTALVQKLIKKIYRGSKIRIMLKLNEKNLEAQLFFRFLGFRAIDILKNFYDEIEEDAYLMRFSINDATAPVFKGKNRISAFFIRD